MISSQKLSFYSHFCVKLHAVKNHYSNFFLRTPGHIFNSYVQSGSTLYIKKNI